MESSPRPTVHKSMWTGEQSNFSKPQQVSSAFNRVWMCILITLWANLYIWSLLSLFQSFISSSPSLNHLFNVWLTDFLSISRVSLHLVSLSTALLSLTLSPQLCLPPPPLLSLSTCLLPSISIARYYPSLIFILSHHLLSPRCCFSLPSSSISFFPLFLSSLPICHFPYPT